MAANTVISEESSREPPLTPYLVEISAGKIWFGSFLPPIKNPNSAGLRLFRLDYKRREINIGKNGIVIIILCFNL